MADDPRAPRGTSDALPADHPARARVEHSAARILGAAGYLPISTPAFEDTALFARGVGESTDIVEKQMFSFTDQGDRDLTLRPEGTAPVCRAYVEHGMSRLAQPVKLRYSGAFFRHERPQAGRYRQFHQVGAEAIGSDSPLLDAELIMLLAELISSLGIDDARLRLGSLGSIESRTAYLDELRGYLRSHEQGLSEEVRGRIDSNPMRAFDADHDGTREVMADAPTLVERLDPADAEHFAAVRSALDAAGLDYEVDPRLVRGLDYYTRTVFEFTCDRLGSQSGLGGGGRYDGLVELVGGKPTPAAGWAAGVERLVLAMDPVERSPAIDAFVVADETSRERALLLVAEFRKAGMSADLDLAGRAVKGQVKQADRLGARVAVFLEEGAEPRVRDMASGDQREVPAERLVADLSAGG